MLPVPTALNASSFSVSTAMTYPTTSSMALFTVSWVLPMLRSVSASRSGTMTVPFVISTVPVMSLTAPVSVPERYILLTGILLS